MLHYVDQLVVLLFGAELVVYSGFIRAFSVENSFLLLLNTKLGELLNLI